MGQLSANPLDPAQSSSWNVAVLAGEPTPGVCRVTNCPRKYRWDVKNVAGAQGQTETYQGWEVVKGIRIKVEMWEREQIDDLYARVIPAIWVDALKATPTPITAYHPALNANQVTTLVVDEIGELCKDSPSGLWSVTIVFIEFRPAKAKNLTATPAGGAKGQSAAKAKADPDPNAAYRAYRDRLAQTAGLTGAR